MPNHILTFDFTAPVQTWEEGVTSDGTLCHSTWKKRSVIAGNMPIICQKPIAEMQPLFWDDGFGGKRGKKKPEGISGTRISKVYITPRVAFVFIQLFISLLQVIIILSANEPPVFQRASEKIQTNAEASVSCEAQNSPVFFLFLKNLSSFTDRCVFKPCLGSPPQRDLSTFSVSRSKVLLINYHIRMMILTMMMMQGDF